MDFSNKTVLITGGTRGIGKAIADYLYECGATLLLTGTRQEQVDRLNAEGSPRKTYLQVDFSDGQSLKRFTERLKEFDRIDVCVNNAGINIVEDFCDVPQEDYDKVYQINVAAPYKILKTSHNGQKRLWAYRKHRFYLERHQPSGALLVCHFQECGRGTYQIACRGVCQG